MKNVARNLILSMILAMVGASAFCQGGVTVYVWADSTKSCKYISPLVVDLRGKSSGIAQVNWSIIYIGDGIGSPAFDFDNSQSFSSKDGVELLGTSVGFTRTIGSSSNVFQFTADTSQVSDSTIYKLHLSAKIAGASSATTCESAKIQGQLPTYIIHNGGS